MVTTVRDNSPQSINTSLFSLQKEIDELRAQINQINSKGTAKLAKGLVPGGKAGQVYTSNGSGSPSWQDAKGEKGDMPDVSNLATKASVEAIKELIPDTATPENQLADKNFVKSELAGKADTRHTHTKSQITDFPTSLPANGGIADYANNGTFGMLGGAKQAVSGNIEDLLNNELCSNQNGGLRGGSIAVSAGQEAKNLGIPGNLWYNFLYIPHRTGLSTPGNDNHMFGTLFVIPMTANNGTFYIIHRINGYNFPAHRFDSAT